MAVRLTVGVLCLVLLDACAAPRTVRLDTGSGAPLEVRSHAAPVKVDAESFDAALTRLMLDAPLRLPPPPHGGLVRAAYLGDDESAHWQRLTRKSFGGVCEPGQRRGDCLSLLDDVLHLSEWDKLGVALALSHEPLRESFIHAMEQTLAPQLFYTVIVTGLLTWVLLAANPEPVFTKAAAIVSVLMLAYLGVEVFLAVVDASRELKRASDRATTWAELEHASQRFAKRLGPEVARVFVLAVTVAASYGMTGGSAWLASRLAMLPSVSEATAGASRLGVHLAHAGQVSAVSVVGGEVVIALPAAAVAMATRHGGSSGRTEHGEERAAQAREGDAHRQVGDANRVIREGRRFVDTETGNAVYVSGERVIITNSEGQIVTQFKNPKANTQARIQSGRWVPVHE
ncbi:hypothetical protein P2318_33340 [Myxococcaceae bacterium GXIMD 01537]